MNLLRPLFALSLLAGTVAQAVVVYKWTDEKGVVHFSDQPVPGAEKVQTGSPNVSHLGGVTAPPQPAKPPPPKPQPRLGYTDISIVSPTPEQVFFSAGVPVHLSVEPGLAAGHVLTWVLNGAALEPHQGQDQFMIDELPRGTYSLTATITNPETQESTSSAPVTFYVHQPSVLTPQHPKP